MNLRRRRSSHDDYDLVDRFRQAVLLMHPCAFVLENVPFLRNDSQYEALIESLRSRYEVHEDVYSYGDWGAATRRRRLFAIGIERHHVDATRGVFEGLAKRKACPQSVADATRGLSIDEADPAFDHDWPTFRTIDKYAHKYATGKYGWYRLEEDKPAPSFGNVMKTYTLRRGRGGSPDRAVSPREAIAILGFPSSYRFPAGVPRTAKYRMAADAVSPVFGEAVANAIAELLGRAESDRVR
jgi:DNA (cytosine-5)-methyltransferase 1